MWQSSMRTFAVAQFKCFKVVAQLSMVRVVALPVSTATLLGRSAAPTQLVRWRGAKIRSCWMARRSAVHVVSFLVFAVELFLKVRDPLVDFRLRFEKALAHVLFDDRQIICQVSYVSMTGQAASVYAPSKKLCSRSSSYIALGFRPVSVRRGRDVGGSPRVREP